MGEQYAGDDVFPEDFTIPDDGDPPTAAAMNVALEALGDRTQFLKNRIFSKTIVTVTTSGPVVAPAKANAAILDGIGGGGGGGAGTGSANADFRSSGGAGGGGAVRSVVMVPITGGATYDVVVAPGGAGGDGDASAVGEGGADGGDSTFTENATSTLLATFRGAGGGQGGGVETLGAGGGGVLVSRGGLAVRGSPPLSYPAASAAKPDLALYRAPQQGGVSATSNVNHFQQAGAAPQGYAGGAPGSADATQVGSYHGAGAGGGGGAGGFGNGAPGGDGTAPNNAGAAVSAGAGADGDPSTGAGGGGGGSSGGASVHTALGGDGGDGGSGRVVIIWLLGA